MSKVAGSVAVSTGHSPDFLTFFGKSFVQLKYVAKRVWENKLITNTYNI